MASPKTKQKNEIDKMTVYEQFTTPCLKQRLTELCEKLNIKPNFDFIDNEHGTNGTNRNGTDGSSHKVTDFEQSKIVRQHYSSERLFSDGHTDISVRKRTFEDVDEHRGGSDD